MRSILCFWLIGASSAISLAGAQWRLIPSYDNGPESIPFSNATCVSAEGQVVGLGVSTDGADRLTLDHPAFFTEAGGLVILAHDPSYQNARSVLARVSGVSSNSKFLVGRVRAGFAGERLAALWEGELFSEYRPVFDLQESTYSAATGVTEDGSIVIGWADVSESALSVQRIFKWERATETWDFLDLPDGYNGGVSAAHPISESGDVILGTASFTEDQAFTPMLYRACLWRDNVPEVLPLPEGMTWSSGYYLSQGGEWVAGRSVEGGDANAVEQATFWEVETGEFRTVGTANGFESSVAYAVSPDGRYGFGLGKRFGDENEGGIFFDLESHESFTMAEFFARHRIASSLDLKSLVVRDLTVTSESAAMCGDITLESGANGIVSFVFVAESEIFPDRDFNLQYRQTDGSGSEHYTLETNSAEDDFIFEFSSNLQDWTPITPESLSKSSTIGSWEVIFAASSESPRFYRVGIESSADR